MCVHYLRGQLQVILRDRLLSWMDLWYYSVWLVLSSYCDRIKPNYI